MKRYTPDPSERNCQPAPWLSPLERRLLDEFQHDLPLVPRPFAAMAERLDTTETTVLGTLERLQRRGLVSRVGATVTARAVGASTLAALAVPEEQLETVAAMISRYPEVNHNYAREHAYNLWFVVVAPDAERLHQVLTEIEARTGLEVLDLPLERAYHIDLGFPLWR